MWIPILPFADTGNKRIRLRPARAYLLPGTDPQEGNQSLIDFPEQIDLPVSVVAVYDDSTGLWVTPESVSFLPGKYLEIQMPPAYGAMFGSIVSIVIASFDARMTINDGWVCGGCAYDLRWA